MHPWSEEYPLREYMRDRLSGIPVAPALQWGAGEEPQDLFVRLWSKDVKTAFHELCEEEITELEKAKVVERPELLVRLMKLAMVKKDGTLAARLFGHQGAWLQALAGAEFEGWSLLHWAALLAERSLPEKRAKGILESLLERAEPWALATVVGLSGLKWGLDATLRKTEYDRWVLNLLVAVLREDERELIERLLADYLERRRPEQGRLMRVIEDEIFEADDLEVLRDCIPPEEREARRLMEVAAWRAKLGTSTSRPVSLVPIPIGHPFLGQSAR